MIFLSPSNPPIYFQPDNHCYLFLIQGFLGGSEVKNLPIMQETQVWSLGWEDPLEKEMANYSSTLAWKPHGWRILGYSLWGCKELGTTEWLHFHFQSLLQWAHLTQCWPQWPMGCVLLIVPWLDTYRPQWDPERDCMVLFIDFQLLNKFKAHVFFKIISTKNNCFL